MAPRVVVLLILTCIFFAVIAGLFTSAMTKNLPTDSSFVYAEGGDGSGEMTMRKKTMINHKIIKIRMRDSMVYCPAWYSSSEIHVLYQAWGWHTVQQATSIKPEQHIWDNANIGINYVPNSLNSYFFKIYRLGDDPVRIRFIDRHPSAKGCGYLGRIPLIPERNTAIDVVTDLLYMPRLKVKMIDTDLSKPTQPLRFP